MKENFYRLFVAFVGLLSILAWTEPTDIYFENSHLDEQEAVIRERIPTVVTIVNPVYTPAVRSYLNTYIYRRPQMTVNMLGWAKYYFPIFEKALQEEGLPTDLKYLAIVESALNPNAISRSGAGGLWQFMKPTAKECGLKCGTYVDERMDPEKSSKAAAHYLRRLYEMFGNWELVMAAYNAGPGRIRSAVKRAGTNDYWKMARYLPAETQSYVPGFIAASYLMNFHSEHNLVAVDPTHALGELTPVVLHKGMHLSELARRSGLTTEIIKSLNPCFVKNYIPASTAGYTLWLPAASAELFNTGLLNNIPVAAEGITGGNTLTLADDPDTKKVVIGGELYHVKTVTKYYTVRSGDNLYDIARRNDCTVKQLMTWNGLHNSRLSIGQKLEMKKTVRELVSTNDPGELMADAGGNLHLSNAASYTYKTISKYHTVRSGDNLYNLANKYDCSVQDLMNWNKLKSSRIAIGQKIEIRKQERVLIPAVVEKVEVPAVRENFSIQMLPSLLNGSLPSDQHVEQVTFDIDPILPLQADHSIVLKRRQSIRQALSNQAGFGIQIHMPQNAVAGDVVKWRSKV